MRSESHVPYRPPHEFAAYPGCRTQGGASLCPGLSHYAPLGLGPMVHRRDLQTGHSPVLRVERQQRNTVARSSEAVRE